MDKNIIKYYILRIGSNVWIAKYNDYYKNKVKIDANGYTIAGIEEKTNFPCVKKEGHLFGTDYHTVEKANDLITKLLDKDIYFETTQLSKSDNIEIQSLLKNLHSSISGITGTEQLTQEEINIIETNIKTME